MSEPEIYRAEYIGGEPGLQGQTFLVQTMPSSSESVRVQADNRKLIYRRTKLGYNWHCMPKEHFRRLES